MRRNVTIGGAVAAALLLAGFLGLQWARNQALAEVETVFAALRAAGLTVEHGPASVNLWSRALQIDGIDIASSGPAAKVVKIARLNADGASISGNWLTASRVNLVDVEVRRPSARSVDVQFTAKAPSIGIENLEVTRSGPVALQGGDVNVATLLQGLRASAITIPAIVADAKLPFAPPPAQPGPRRSDATTEITYTYSNVTLARISDGRIGKIDVGKLAFTGSTGSGTGDGSTMEDLDLMPFFGVGLGSRQAINGYYRVQGKTSLGPMSVKLPDGGELAIAGMAGSGLNIDPARFSYQTFLDALSAMGDAAQPPAPAQMAAMMESVAKLYEGMQIDQFELRDLRLKSLAGDVRLARTTLAGLSKGKLDTFRFDDLGVSPPATPGRPAAPAVKIGSFTLKGLDIAGSMRKASRFMQAPGAPPPGAEDLFALLDGIEMTDSVLPDPVSGNAIRVDRVKLSWARPVNAVPADIQLAFKGEIQLNPADRNQLPLLQLGLRSLAADIELGSRFDATRQELILAPIRFKADKLGTLTGQASLGNVPAGAYSFTPFRFQSAMPAFSISSIELAFDDDGLVALTRPQATAPGAARPDIAAALKQQLLDPAQPDGNLAAILDGIGKLLDGSGRRLAVELAPKGTVRLADLQVPTPPPPGALAQQLEKFSVDVRLSR